ncbi:MAG: nuclear transport factor 2 family protein [Planctomycetota bacterium]
MSLVNDLLLLCLVGTAGLVPAQSPPPRHAKAPLAGGGQLEWAVRLPAQHDAAARAPALVVVDGAATDRATLDTALAAAWVERLVARGWIVVMPAHSSGLPTGAVETEAAALVQQVRETWRIEGSRLHLAGVRGGGPRARRWAAWRPFEFASLTLDTGPAPEPAAVPGVAAHVQSLGALDGWTEHLAQQRTRLQPAAGPEAAVVTALEDFHASAAIADGPRYFGAFAPEGVFLGTDATERWTLAEFRAFAEPYFDRASAWIYVPQVQRVTLAPSGEVAWFDEELGHARLGECRGSGALRRIDGVWKIAQYNLVVPVPNDLMAGVAARIRAYQRGQIGGAGTIVLLLPMTRVDEAVVAAPVLRHVEALTVYALDLEVAEAAAERFAAAGRRPEARDFGGGAALATDLREHAPGQVALVIGATSVLTEVATALGATLESDPETGDLVVLTVAPEGTSALRLHL